MQEYSRTDRVKWRTLGRRGKRRGEEDEGGRGEGRGREGEGGHEENDQLNENSLKYMYIQNRKKPMYTCTCMDVHHEYM